MAQRKVKENKAVPPVTKKEVDWKEVGEMYTRGMKTISELARYTGYSRGKVLNELKKIGAYKDSTGDIQRRAEVKMATDGKLGSTTRRSGQTVVLSEVDEERVIENESERIAQVQLNQRHQIGMVMEEMGRATILLRAERKTLEKLLVKQDPSMEKDLGEQEELSPGELDLLTRATKAKKSISASYIREELGKLAQSYAKVIPLERQLHGIDKMVDGAGDNRDEEAKKRLSDKQMAEEIYSKLDDMLENVGKKAGE